MIKYFTIEDLLKHYLQKKFHILGYRGEIHAIISNVSSESQILHKDTRVGQLVITPVLIADFVLDLGEARDIGAFGSTGE